MSILLHTSQKLDLRVTSHEASGLVGGFPVMMHSNEEPMHTLIIYLHCELDGNITNKLLNRMKESGLNSGWRCSDGVLAVVLTSLLPNWNTDLPYETMKTLTSMLLHDGAKPVVKACSISPGSDSGSLPGSDTEVAEPQHVNYLRGVMGEG